MVALIDKTITKKQWEHLCLQIKKDYENIIGKKDNSTSHINDGFGHSFSLPTYHCIKTISQFSKDRKKMVKFLKKLISIERKSSIHPF